ncbi:hypothetical protein C0995_014736 [Termitomyces sp. Mi166|nr:hypothetical protein C0995_014736 [Termitomyces sp. Mi166\
MPKLSRRSQQAKAQNMQGKRRFGSGLIDDNLTAKLQDPDFVPSDSEEWEDEHYHRAYTLYVGVSKSTMATDGGEEDTDLEEVNSSDLENAIILEPGDEAEPLAKRPRLGALPTYSGTSQATFFKKKKALSKAAKGCKKINSFFVPQVSKERTHTSEADKGAKKTTEIMEVHVIMGLEDEVQSETVPLVSSPELEEHVDRSFVEEVDEIPVEEVDEIPIEEVDEIPVEELLDITVDDEFDSETSHAWPGIEGLVEQLLKDAKRHKSYGAVFKLQAVKDYLGLCKKFSANPKIKNLRTRAAFAVAKGVGKGAYFARQVAHLIHYMEHFRALPPSGSGKHHAHLSILNCS